MDTASAARQIAAESLLTDPLTQFDRDIIGSDSVRINIPLRDPAQLKHHLQVLNATIHECILLLDRGGSKDRSLIFDVRGRIRMTGKKINCFRKMRPI